MKIVIMAGGKGTRISELFPDIPKPLIPITASNGIAKPVLQWEIESLVTQGFTEIIITVSYMADKIMNFFGDGHLFGCNIQYYTEETPLGNAGALFKLREVIGSEPFLLLNADAVFEIDFNRFFSAYMKKREECGALVMLFTHPNSHPYDSGIVIADESGAVQQWLTKEDTRPEFYKNRVNAGLHVIDPLILDLSGIDANLVGKVDEETGKIYKVDLDRQLLKPLCNTGKMFVYDSPEYVKDMGTPERFMQVSHDFQSGVVSSKNLNKPQKAIFLDRDGTINKHVGFLRDISALQLIDGAAEAIKMINQSGFLAIVATNQPVVARGEVTFSELNHIHEKLETLLGNEGAYIDGLYFCPHHPHKGYAGEVEELKIDCDCRKPKPGLLIQASIDFNIDMNSSWMIGDGKNDVLCGKNAGVHTALIKGTDDDEAYKADNFGADLVGDNLLEIIKRIL